MRQERVLLYVKHIINYCCKIEFIKTELQQGLSCPIHIIYHIVYLYNYYLGIDSTAAGNNIKLRVRVLKPLSLPCPTLLP